MEEVFQATILKNTGSWEKGTAITILLQKGTAITILLQKTTPLMIILDRLRKMAEVEDVRDKPMTKHKLFNFLKQFIAGTETRLQKDLLVTLKQADSAKQFELACYNN